MILGYIVLAPAVLATSVAYAVFLSTPLGLEPGGEYTHISRTFGGYGIAFVGTWLKIISYIGALAYLAVAFAEYTTELSAGLFRSEQLMPLALSGLEPPDSEDVHEIEDDESGSRSRCARSSASRSSC